MKKTPKYDKFKFESLASYNEWVKAKAYAKIFLQETGSNLTHMYVIESGEIIAVDAKRDMYVGRFVNIGKLYTGYPIEFWSNINGTWELDGTLLIDLVTYLR